MEECVNYKAPAVKERLRQAYKKVFEGEDGEFVLDHLLHVAGLTTYAMARDADDRLRKEERQRFVFGILDQLTLTAQQLRVKTMKRIEHKNTNTQMQL